MHDHALCGNRTIRIYTCPNKQCGYNVSEDHYRWAKFDLKCPRCDEHYLSAFTHKGKTYGEPIKTR